MNLMDVDMFDGKFRLGGVEYATGLTFSGPVSIGIRPEFVRLGSGARATVTWIENLGSQFLVGARIDKYNLTLLTPERPSSETINISMDEAHIHVFEAATGRNLRAGSSTGAADRELAPGGYRIGSK